MKKVFFTMLLSCLVMMTHAQPKTVTRALHTFGFDNNQTFPSGDLDENVSFTTTQGAATTAPTYRTSSSTTSPGRFRIYADNATTKNGNSIVFTPKNGVTIISVSVANVLTDGTITYSADGGEAKELSSIANIDNIGAKTSLVVTNAGTGSYGSYMQISNISVTYLEAGKLYSSIEPREISLYGWVGNMEVKNFSVAAFGLTPATGNVSLTLPVNFEASVDGGSYAASLNLPYTNGALPTKTISVRLKNNLSIGDYSGSLAVAGGGISGTVALKASVRAQTTVDVQATKVTVSNLIFGRLAQELAEQSGITELKVTGTMDERDFTTIRNIATLEKVDLTGITKIEAYNKYPANAVPDGAFQLHSTALTEILLPENVIETIGASAFSGNGSVNKDSKLSKLVIPASVKRIESSAFRHLPALTELTIPAGLEWLSGTQTFGGLSYIGQIPVEQNKLLVRFPENPKFQIIPDIGSTDGLATMTSTFFRVKVESFFVPGNVKEIKNAFINTGLKTLTFSTAGNLKKVTGLTGTELTELVLPEGVTEIGDINITTLKKADLPSTLEKFSNNVFTDSKDLESIVSRAIFPPNATVADFANVDKTKCTVYVPAEAIEFYKEEPGWKDFGDNIKAMGSGTATGDIENFDDFSVGIDAGTVTLKATAKGNRTITYSIEEEKGDVATLSGNVVTLKGEGSVKITATAPWTVEHEKAEKEITLAVVNYAWLKVPAIAVEGSTTRVVGPAEHVEAFTKFFIDADEVESYDNNNGADLSGIEAGKEVTLKATDVDGTQVIRLVISK